MNPFKGKRKVEMLPPVSSFSKHVALHFQFHQHMFSERWSTLDCASPPELYLHPFACLNCMAVYIYHVFELKGQWRRLFFWGEDKPCCGIPTNEVRDDKEWSNLHMLGISINGMYRAEMMKMNLMNKVKWVQRMSVECPTIWMIGFELMKMIIHSNMSGLLVSGKTEALSIWGYVAAIWCLLTHFSLFSIILQIHRYI